MLNTPMSRRGMVVAPHHLAAQAGLAILREGGNAIEAAIAAAAASAVVYPHMNGLGGDGFWLIAEPGKPPVSIDGSGAAGGKVDADLYRGHRLKAVPVRGPLAAATVAGAVSGWQLALDVSAHWGGGMGLDRLFEDAVHLARDGFAVTRHQVDSLARNLSVLRKSPGFSATFLNRNKPLPVGAIHTQPRLAETFERLAEVGLDDFYRGDIARALAEDLKAAGSPLKAEDLARHRGMRRRPLSLGLPAGTVFTTAPPTQGLATLILLGVFQRLGISQPDSFAWVHGLAEATKLAYRVRNAHLTDPHRMSVHATTYLTDHLLDRMAGEIDPARAAHWPHPAQDADTAWIGVIDGQGRAVSYIQSLFHAFGSGVVSPSTGIVWHNRASSFALDPAHRNALEPRRKPLHTLAPALARLKDGRSLVWGCMGGDAQPQVVSQIFTRAILLGQDLQEAVSAPRFALGRGLDGRIASDLKLEARFSPEVVEALAAAGHQITEVAPFDPALGQAGALLRHAGGTIEGAADPRSDGAAAGW
ncbi:putative gamma-glutamyltransferase ywrD [Magnetospirillum sp. LM-5]|uniref:gamma-glutamyltransferase family protein n=1 Tax=Magnetospirillum sp. LM-5 TaxID=2681466 RepID=UPI001381FEB7|nr:gamma-glutamyltransferase family protein [Magnetospirillum sp. LM-5]CAA7622771.1 putative gamma-glutamyltransferase ywrD [Magnetospirillum sp. LM-5]